MVDANELVGDDLIDLYVMGDEYSVGFRQNNNSRVLGSNLRSRDCTQYV